jgi:DNA-binding NtrC family response regulator
MEHISTTAKKLSPMRPRVLVAEDDPTQRAIWKQIIRLACGDADIYFAESYQTAAEILECKTISVRGIDLLVSDVFLSGEQTGFQLCKNFYHGLNGKVILVSNFGELKIPSASDSLMNHEPFYLTKPMNPEFVISMVRRVLTK